MKIIYFKRAGSEHSHLHPLFITEYAAAEHLTDEQKAERESMIEEHFELELAKNEERHEQHVKYLKEQENLKFKAERDAEIVAQAQDKELEREFEQFKRWKQNKGKK